MLHFPSHIDFFSLRKIFIFENSRMSRNNNIFLSNVPAIQLGHYVIPAYGLRATTTTTVKLLDARRST
jgi:hypothetical protein